MTPSGPHKGVYMLATHVYMHRSPRCSVEIEIEKQLEKEEELEKGKKSSGSKQTRTIDPRCPCGPHALPWPSTTSALG